MTTNFSIGGDRFVAQTGTKAPLPETDLRADRAYKIAVLLKNYVNPAYRTAVKAGSDAAARYGFEVTPMWPETPDDLAEQNALFRNILDAGTYDALVFTPVDPEAQIPLFERANEEQLSLFNISNIVDGGAIVAFVGCDDAAIGRKLIEWLAQASGGQASILLLEGSPSAPTARLRLKGVHEQLAEHRDLILLANRVANFDRRQAAEVTAELLPDYPNADTIVALNDEMALGAIATLEREGKLADFRVLGVNGTPEGLKAVQAGKLAATVDYALYAITYKAMELAVRYLNGERLEEQLVLLPTPIYDATNIGEAVRQRQLWGVM
jgi:ribose transport system substrate-binding protein